MVGIAAPVFDASRAPIAVLCLTIDRDTLDDTKVKDLSDTIWAASTRLSDALTHAFRGHGPREL